MTAPVENIPFTDFIQHPTASTGRLTSVRALRLRRREAEDLVVTTAARADREGEVMQLVARLLALIVRRGDGRTLVQRLLGELLPWVSFLPADDREVLVREFVAVAQAATSIDSVAPIAQLLTEWRHTAEVHADPELYALLSAPRGEDHGPAYPPDAQAAA
jgi:hypothetical protein